MHTDEELTDIQEIFLAILPIPSAILSMVGSSVIIYMSLKNRERRWTPYSRLLLGMSTTDILFSIVCMLGNLLRPQETSPRAWAFGNSASCSAMGFLLQLGYASIFYNAMLSFYFLLSARFGLKNRYISKHIEPVMHFLSIGFPLVTASVGLNMDVYAEPSTGLGCWVNNYPRNCGEGPGKSGEPCLSILIGWIFLGIPYILILIVLITNNLIIWNFVRKQSLPSKSPSKGPTNNITAERRNSDSSRSSEQDFEAVINEPDHTFSGSDRYSADTQQRILRPRTQASVRHQQQVRRLKLVKSQAFLFVSSYFISQVWSGIMALIETYTERDEELGMLVKFYPIMVMQAIFLPLQGLFNMIVFLRPKYLKYRQNFPKESRTWALRRIIHGDSNPHYPEQPKHDPLKQDVSVLPKDGVLNSFTQPTSKLDPETKKITIGDIDPTSNYTRLPRNMVSSMTASEGDFDDITDEECNNGTRWGENSKSHGSTVVPLKTTPRFRSSLITRGSSLEMISETSELVFESLQEEDEVEVESQRRGERRWSTGSERKEVARSMAMSMNMPRRIESTGEIIEVIPNESFGDLELDSGSPSQSLDAPVRLPRRTMSPQPVMRS